MSEKVVEGGLTKDAAYALGQRLGAERMAEAVAAAAKRGVTPEDDEAWVAWLRENPVTGYMVHHDRIPPPDEITRTWGPEEWAEFESDDWEVTEYTHEPRYLVEHSDADGETEFTMPHDSSQRHAPPGGWVAAYGDPANALRHRDHLRANHPPKGKRGHARVRHRTKGHEVEWAEG